MSDHATTASAVEAGLRAYERSQAEALDARLDAIKRERLRDEMAMAALKAASGRVYMDHDQLASECYKYADAMLKAREAKNGE